MTLIAMRYQMVLSAIAEGATSNRRLPSDITLVCVSKNRSISEILEVYDAGCRDFGEGRVQEALEKIPQLPADIRWHFIGTLQSNKVKKVIGKFALIHAVDSPALAQTISAESAQAGVTTSVLLQANTSGEASKHGYAPKEWRQAFQPLINLPSLQIQGLMTLAPLTEDTDIIKRCFSALADLRADLQKIAPEKPLVHLSMGMSHDFLLAITCGATLVRVGTAIFGDAL
jgi:PLP dependent protein